MKQMKAVTKMLFLVLLLALLSGSHPALAREITDPYAIFHDYYEAMGGLQIHRNIKTIYAEGKAVYDGLEGTFKHWGKKPLRFLLVQDYQVIALTEGDDGNFSWMKDSNDQLLIFRDEETVKRRRVRELLENFEHLNRKSPYFTLAFEGKQSVEGRECYVVKMANTINEDITWFFFETSGFHLIKSLDQEPDIEIHTTYSDYREIQSILVPFREESLILPRGKKIISTLSKYRINPALADSLFRIPEQRTPDYRFQEGSSAENIPFLFSEDMIYLPVTIGDHTTLWTLDSGATLSAIDRDYAIKLGLTPQGSIKGFGFGETFDLSFVTLPSYRVGTITMEPRKAFAFDELAGGSYEPEITGILGYDFLSRFVTRIDYAAQTVSFYDPATFTYQGEGTIIDAPLKYRTFSVPLKVDGTLQGKWGIDLGAYQSSFLYPYAEKHGLLDRKGVSRVSRGMSSQIIDRLVQFKTLEIEELVIQDPQLAVPLEKGKGTSAIGELAGNLGNSILRHFVVYLDYQRQQVILEKGKQFNQPFPKDRGGMTIGRSEDGRPMIVHVADGTPAHQAGFKAGDLIAAVNGKEAHLYGGIVPIRKLLRQRAGTTHLFKIRRGGTFLEIKIVLAELF